ncbi:hypothetical protein [Marinococcus halotolerans]|uniref:hypothetical protein n=1 Tax=Marinococcus halotolerans TaxID=301092 RepID=UPI0003B5DF50|nr:hypothetical protein [Marinococcus halotolerans]
MNERRFFQVWFGTLTLVSILFTYWAIAVSALLLGILCFYSPGPNKSKRFTQPKKQA